MVELRKDGTLSAFATRTLGRYELLTQIGKGGMAEVHLAMQRGPGGFEKLVVIKLIHEHLAAHPAFVEMLLDEGRLAGMIKHPNVIDIYDLGEADGQHYVAMEYLDGEPLLAILRRGVEGERLDPWSTARVIADTAEGLEAAHRLKSLDGKPLGLIHHDVSLGNIVILYNGQVKLVDFGVAKVRKSGKEDLVQGKFGYMAPEKLDDGEIDRRSDIWSLGVVAWEALTLQRLFKAKTDEETVKMVLELAIPPPSTVNKDLPAELDPIVMRALERDPEKRISTAKAFALELEAVLRKRGYAGKNDRIAAYMEKSFADQIQVRERLVAELSAGRTSQASIAAFTKATTSAAQQPMTPVPGMVTPEVSDGLPSHPDLSAAGTPASRSHPAERGDPSVERRRESIRDLQQWVDDERRWRSLPWWQRNAPFLAGGAVLLVLVLIVARCNSGGESKPGQLAVAAPDTTETVAPKPREPEGSGRGIDLRGDDNTHAGSAGSGSGSAVIDDEITFEEMPPAVDKPPVDKPSVDKPSVDKPPVSKPAQVAAKPTEQKPADKPVPAAAPTTADGWARLGISQLNKNDGNGALASFLQATKLNASHAPGWYGLGRAYQATGTRKGPTKAAYLRYLSLAPAGQYAADTRARMAKL